MAGRAALALSPNDRVRIAAIDLLVERGPEAIPTLVEQLGDDSWVVRRKLVAELAQLGDASTVPLCDLLEHRRPSEAAIAAAVDALAALKGNPDDSLELLARSKTPAIVCDAAHILGRRRSSRSIPILRDLLGHPDDNVAVAAIEALGRFRGEQALEAVVSASGSRNFFRVFPTIEVLGESGDFRAVSPLLKLLADPLYEASAARALGRLGGRRAVDALMTRLVATTDPSLVGVLVSALVELGGRAADSAGVIQAVRGASSSLTARLLQLIAKGNERSKIEACKLLAWARNPSATDALVPLLDGKREVAEAAASALVALSGEVSGVVSQILREGPSARRAVLLPVLNEARYVDQISPCLADPEAPVRSAACSALARSGSTASVEQIFPLIADKDMMVSQAALAAVQSLGSTRTEALALEAASSSTDPRLQRAAFRIIGYFGYLSGLEPTLRGTQVPDARVRDAAIQALAYIPHARAAETLMTLCSHELAPIRSAAVRALRNSSSTDPEVLEAVRRALTDPDAWVRYFACQSVGRLADVAAEPKLLALMRDDAGQVRIAAIEALARIASRTAFDAIAAVADSPDLDQQRAALLALGQLGNPAGVLVLVRALESADPSIRLVALSAITNLGEEHALPATMRAAGDSDDGVRTAAIGLLAASQSPGSTDALISMLSEKALHPRILTALSVASGPRIAGILDALESAEGEAASVLVQALRDMPQNAGWRALLSCLHSAGAPGRRAAARVLALSSAAEARAALQRAATADPEADIRRLCQLAVGPE